MNNGGGRCNDQGDALRDRATRVPRIGAGMEPASLAYLMRVATSRQTSTVASSPATGFPTSPNPTSHTSSRARHSRPISSLDRHRIVYDILEVAIFIADEIHDGEEERSHLPTDQRPDESQ
jgi:hypothetical protein